MTDKTAQPLRPAVEAAPDLTETVDLANREAFHLAAAEVLDKFGEIIGVAQVECIWRSLSAARVSAPAASPGGVEGWSKALQDIAAERRRQMEDEGWTSEHDDEHDCGELAAAASAYALAGSITDGMVGRSPPAVWPWPLSWWKPKGRRRNLERAGALIAAEIERLDRASAPAPREA